MTSHKVVSSQQWLDARRELLLKEKEFSRLRDELSQMQRDLPWEKVEKNYTFDGPRGKVTLAELFEGKSQLIVYHFMFAADWDEGCKSCSFIADHYNPSIVHLQNRDVSMVTVSKAPIAKLEAFKKRMGWTFNWVSSCDNDFNLDYKVTFSQEDLDRGETYYNYKLQAAFPASEGPGLSVFFKDDDGQIYHTYSTFSRGLDVFLGAYHLLDVVPKGRDEKGLVYAMEWVRHHDKYGDKGFVDPYVKVLIARNSKNEN